MISKSEIMQAYYYTDIEPTLDNLKEIIKICDTFQKEGGDRLLCVIGMRKWDLEEIERLTVYIVQARQKMETELMRLRKYKDKFNDEFATDHNNYYNSVAGLLAHIHSHTSPLKKVLKKTCDRRHPNKRTCQTYGINPKSVRKESTLAKDTYQMNLFDINDPSIPEQVKGLFNELQKFFNDEKECMEICMEVIQEETKIKKDPALSKYVLDKSRRQAFMKLKGQIMLISDGTIGILQEITPSYQRYREFPTEEAFAQEELHKHNTTDIDHLFLIELALTKQKNMLDNDELANWGDNPEKVKHIKYVIKHFDDILPDYFTHKMMGRFQYYFCKWALPGNISNGTRYFTKHYTGKWTTSKYGAVNSHGKEYDQHSEEVKNFFSAIQRLLNGANMQEMDVSTT